MVQLFQELGEKDSSMLWGRLDAGNTVCRHGSPVLFARVCTRTQHSHFLPPLPFFLFIPFPSFLPPSLSSFPASLFLLSFLLSPCLSFPSPPILSPSFLPFNPFFLPPLILPPSSNSFFLPPSSLPPYFSLLPSAIPHFLPQTMPIPKHPNPDQVITWMLR